jgi:hypothetical protein
MRSARGPVSLSAMSRVVGLALKDRAAGSKLPGGAWNSVSIV